MARADGERFTAALVNVIERDFWGQRAAAPADAPSSGGEHQAR